MPYFYKVNDYNLHGEEFLDKVGHENAVLLMHTEPTDPNGPDLIQIVEDLDHKQQVVEVC